MGAAVRKVRECLDEHGYTEAESILDEWNYVRDWNEGFTRTIKTIIGLKGAVFTAAAMCVGQNPPADMLMYYDARPCAFNGIFDVYTLEPLKGYYTFLAWSKLAGLGSQFALDTKNKNGIYAVGATDGKGHAGILICRYFEPDLLPGDLEISVHLNGTGLDNAKVLLLDETHDLTEVQPEAKENSVIRIRMQANTMVYIEFGGQEK